MKATFDINSTLFQILKGSTQLNEAISGGVYVDERPDNSEKEDVIVNTIDLTQEYLPQLGSSNVNIHVKDLTVNIKGAQQSKQNTKRLKELTAQVLSVLREAKIEGIAMVVTNQNVIKEREVKQHYTNIRIDWVIH